MQRYIFFSVNHMCPSPSRIFPYFFLTLCRLFILSPLKTPIGIYLIYPCFFYFSFISPLFLSSSKFPLLLFLFFHSSAQLILLPYTWRSVFSSGHMPLKDGHLSNNFIGVCSTLLRCEELQCNTGVLLQKLYFESFFNFFASRCNMLMIMYDFSKYNCQKLFHEEM